MPNGLRTEAIYYNTGNVGIGTKSPANPLHIVNNNYLQSLVLQSNSAGWGAGMLFKNTAAQGKSYGIYSSSLGNWHFADNTLGVDRLFISPSGNVGIGTTAPQANLHINGTVQAKSIWIRDNGDNAYVAIQGNSTFHLIGSYAAFDDKAVFIAGYNAYNSTIATEKVFIGNHTTGDQFTVFNMLTGKVGMGTTNINDTAYRLFVETGIRTRKVKVDADNWPIMCLNPGTNYAL